MHQLSPLPNVSTKAMVSSNNYLTTCSTMTNLMFAQQ